MDWDILRLQGVDGCVVKSTQGTYATDRMMETHAIAADKARVWLGFYHWLDPIYSGKEQAEYMLKAINRFPYRAIAVDLEQWWSDWDPWNAWRLEKDKVEKARLYTLIPKLSPTKINSCLAAFIKYAQTTVPNIDIIIYTRPTYIIEYCQLLYSWIGDYKLWYAYYPYASGAVTCSWDTFRLAWLPAAVDVKYPRGYPDHLKRWDMWQFTGDKFTLPGFHSKMDINYRISPDMPKHIKPSRMDRFSAMLHRLLWR